MRLESRSINKFEYVCRVLRANYHYIFILRVLLFHTMFAYCVLMTTKMSDPKYCSFTISWLKETVKWILPLHQYK